MIQSESVLTFTNSESWFLPFCSLCYSQWAYCTAYRRKWMDNFSFKRLYLQLDEATVSFNGDPDMVRAVICFTACMQHLPPAYLVRRQVIFSVCLSVHGEEGTPGFWFLVTGPWPFPRRGGGFSLVRPVTRGYPWTGPRGTPERGRSQDWRYSPHRPKQDWGTPPPPHGQDQTLHLLCSAQYASCGHAGGLSCYITEQCVSIWDGRLESSWNSSGCFICRRLIRWFVF